MTGITLTNEILRRTDLSATDKVIYGVLKQMRHIDTIPKLSFALSISESTVRRSMKVLREKGLI